jgi:hypothetical protein
MIESIESLLHAVTKNFVLVSLAYYISIWILSSLQRERESTLKD